MCREMLSCSCYPRVDLLYRPVCVVLVLIPASRADNQQRRGQAWTAAGRRSGLVRLPGHAGPLTVDADRDLAGRHHLAGDRSTRLRLREMNAAPTPRAVADGQHVFTRRDEQFCVPLTGKS
jgi:hypothetical protein